MKRVGSLIVLLAAEIGAIAALHQAGSASWLQIAWSDLLGWLNSSSPEDALAAILRLVALVLAYWLLSTTIVYLVARATRIPGAVRAVEWVTLPAVRRVVDRVAALTLAAATVAAPVAPAFASEPPPVVYDVDEGVPLPRLVPIPASTPSATYTPVPAGTGESVQVVSTVAIVTAAIQPTVASYEVEAGDSLWSIASAIVTKSLGGQPDDRTTADYWRRLIAANQGTTRSGDPDLIFPGESLVIPSFDG